LVQIQDRGRQSLSALIEGEKALILTAITGKGRLARSLTRFNGSTNQAFR
jgi:hypothetical protein